MSENTIAASFITAALFVAFVCLVGLCFTDGAPAPGLSLDNGTAIEKIVHSFEARTTCIK